MKRRLNLIIFIFGIIGFLAFSCGKGENKLFSHNQNISGMILYFGEPAVDGCGWLIKIGNDMYSPVFLDPTFKKDSLKVIIDYDVLNSSFNCGWRVPGYLQIDIKNIKNQ